MAGLPPWFGFNFTPTIHSSPPASLSLSSQKLPSPFVVVIIGGTRNIGAATAKAFAQAGATGIIVTGSKQSPALHKAKAVIEAAATAPGIIVTALAADVTDTSSAQRVADAVRSHHGGRLGVLINNAAFVSTNVSAYSKLGDIDCSQLETTMQGNYVGKFAAIKALLPFLQGTQGGAKTIINTTSAAAFLGSMGSFGYNVSELAVLRLNEAVAETYGADGVLAFAVHPGVIATQPPPIGQPPRPESGPLAGGDDLGLLGALSVWLAKERPQWLQGRYLSANWDVDDLVAMKDRIADNDLLKVKLLV